MRLLPHINYLFISIISFLSVISAVLIQKHYELNPCAVCIMARYCLLIIGLSALSTFFIKTKEYKKGTQSPKTRFLSGLSRGLTYLALITGLGFALRHIYIVQQQIDSCNIDPLKMFLNNLSLAEIFPTLFQATGSCLDSNFYFLGVPFTLLTLGLYILLIILCIVPQFKNIDIK